jgi:uncharacterized repeat protein (TIGR03837 family)
MASRLSSLLILCKVVDNFGDIGVAYRLARDLSELDPGLSLFLVVDDLGAFSALDPAIDPNADIQSAHGWTVIRWDSPWAGFSPSAGDGPSRLPRFIVECFACGRPDWLESLLFSPGPNPVRHIVNLEYLTAQDYSIELHLMPSATRCASVKKTVFMPGFSPRSGGLILGRDFLRSRELYLSPATRSQARAALGLAEGAEGAGCIDAAGSPKDAEDAFWVSIFTYERDFSPFVSALAEYAHERPVLALVASGKSQEGFCAAWEALERPFPCVALPFLPQEQWDDILLASDLSLVRGEDSLSRAALCGRPFLWQAYPHADKEHIVKAEALLGRLKTFLDPASFPAYASLSLSFNGRQEEGGASGEPRAAFLRFLRAIPRLEGGFRGFSESLLDIGDLGAALLTFFKRIV